MDHPVKWGIAYEEGLVDLTLGMRDVLLEAAEAGSLTETIRHLYESCNQTVTSFAYELIMRLLPNDSRAQFETNLGIYADEGGIIRHLVRSDESDGLEFCGRIEDIPISVFNFLSEDGEEAIYGGLWFKTTPDPNGGGLPSVDRLFLYLPLPETNIFLVDSPLS